MVPVAGTSKGFGISTMMSGLMFQPLSNVFAGGASLGLPAGAPASAHAASVWIWRDVSFRSFENTPTSGSANHGGICFAVVLVFIARAQGRASSYEMSDIGATSPGRWHVWQLFWRMGRTSL